MQGELLYRKIIIYIMLAFALSLPISMAAAGASTVTMIEPYNYTISNGAAVHLGKDGPGQTFFVTISAATTNATGAQLNLGWNKLVVSGLPQGWIAQNSSLYTSELSVKITPAADASNGTYKFNITAINVGNYSKIGAVEFTAYINVTPNVFKLYVNPTTVYESTGTPVDIYVSINNTGVSDTPFLVNITGIPAFNQTTEVIALHHTTQEFTYPISAYQPGVYHVKLSVQSIFSPLVYKQSNITMVSKATVLNDYGAIGSGVVAFPIIYEPVYAVMYLISRLFNG